MHKRVFWMNILVIFGMLFSGSLFTGKATAAQLPAAVHSKAAAAYRPGVVLVGIYNEALGATTDSKLPGRALSPAQSTLDNLQQQLGTAKLTPMFTASVPQKLPGQKFAASPEALTVFPSEATTIFELTLDPGASMESALASLRQNALVAFAEPDYVAVPSATTPDDPRLGEQWGLSKIQALEAWDTAQGSSDTIIAVIDSGIKADHIDLASQLWTNPNEIAGNGLDDDHNGFVDDVHGANIFTKTGALSDSTGHGTQVAGVIAAATNNAQGVAGVCWNCKLMIVKVMSATGTANYSDIAAGINYAVKMGAKVINLSLGGYSDSATLKAAVQAAAQTAIVVAGAGNDNKSDPFYPAAYTDSVMAVAGTDPSDVKHNVSLTNGSNFGTWISVSAPGENILTTDFGGTYYSPGSGTSLAAPFVSGLAGLLVSQNPGWSPVLVRQQIVHTVDSIDSANPGLAGKLGSGRINAFKAVTTAPKANFSIQDYTVSSRISGAIKADGNPVALWLTLRNDWLSVSTATATLSSSSPDVQISKDSATLTAGADGLTVANSADAFQVAVTDGKYGLDLPFQLDVTAGGVTQTLNFSVMSESQEMKFSGSITSDTTWLSSRTYHVNGNLTVKNTAILTIEPGTQIQIDPTFFIKIEGTLIADGTAEAPIVFTTSDTGNKTWKGLTFTDLTVPAAFDSGGMYQSGSILRQVEISYADNGVTLQSKAPYIADSLFRQNGYGITQGNDSSVRIEGCTFRGNTTGIGLFSGKAQIRQNTFTSNGTAIGSVGSPSTPNSPTIDKNLITNNGMAINLSSWSSSGAPTITGNTITNQTNTMYSVLISGSVTLRDNRITGNTSGVTGSDLPAVDIQHNLIANNGANTSCAMPPCTSNATVSLVVSLDGSVPSRPSLVYNPDKNEYLAVWSEGMTQTVKAQRLSVDGFPLGIAVQIGAGQNPVVAYNSAKHEYMVAYSLYSGPGIYAILGQRLSDTNGFIGSPISLASNFTDMNNYITRIQFQSGDGLYLIVWRGTPSGGSDGLYAQYVDGDGALVNARIPIGSGSFYSINQSLYETAYDSNLEHSLIAYHATGAAATCGATPTCIAGVWVTSSGVSAPFKMADDPFGNPYNLAVAYGSGANAYGLAWGSFGNNRKYVYGQNNLAADGSMMDSSPIVLDLLDSISQELMQPAISYSATNNKFLNVWSVLPFASGALGASTVMGRFTGPDGAPINEPFEISTTNGQAASAVAYNSTGNQFLVAWVDYRNNSYKINAQLLSSIDGAKVGGRINVSQGGAIRTNTIINNLGTGLQIGGSGAGSLSIGQNNLFGNKTYDISLNAGTKGLTITATQNFWGATAPGEIGGRINDCNDEASTSCSDANATLGKVIYDPVLTNPSQYAPAFVAGTSYDPDTFGINMLGNVTVDFSRPMDTTKMPALTFFDSRRGILEDIPGTASGKLVARDVSGNIWIGCDNLMTPATPCWGIKRFDGQHWTIYNTSNGLGSNKISVLYITRGGEVWAAHPDQVMFSRLVGGTWKQYSSTDINLPGFVGGVGGITEDNSGKIWFIAANGVYSFDGMTWKHYTKQDGLLNDMVGWSTSIARDGQGRLWFAHNSSPDIGFSVYDGAQWVTYKPETPANALPAGVTSIGSPFGDSKGRIWFPVSIPDPNTIPPSGGKYLGMVDGSTWRFFGQGDSGYPLNSSPYGGFAELPNGNILCFSSGASNYSAALYDGKEFTAHMSSWSAPLVFDAKGNLWMGANYMNPSATLARVQWAGNDYTFDPGTWLTSTRYQASYYFTPRIPQGTYQVAASGAFGSDGMESLAGGSTTFKVDYAGQVSESAPPYAPRVFGSGKNGDPAYMKATWTVTDPNNQVDSYRVAIGTSQGGTDVLYWTTTSQAQLERSGLPLTNGQTYWVSVQAHNQAGLWGSSGYSSFVAGKVSNLKVYIPMTRK